MDIQTQGVILSYRDYREVDRIIVAYTKDLGKIFLIARGARKIKAKLAGHLELFNVTELQLVAKRNFLVISAIHLNTFSTIKSNSKKLKVAFAISELIEKSTPEQQGDENIFNITCDALELLEQAPKNFELIYYWFAFNLLARLGYKPELKKCVECRKSLSPASIFFSVEYGGMLCGDCEGVIAQDSKNYIQKISPNTLKVMRLFFEDKALLGKLQFNGEVLVELRKVTQRYLRFNLGIEINSIEQF